MRLAETEADSPNTWELDAHLLLERTIVLDTALGGVEACSEAVAEALS